MSAESYTSAVADIYEKLLPLRDRLAAIEARLRRVLANATADELSAARIDGNGHDEAARRLAAKARRDRAAAAGLDGTPMGIFLAGGDP